MKRLLLLAALLVVTLAAHVAAQPKPAAPTKPEGEMRWALYVTLAPAWFDPSETTAGFITPFWILYALHDALVKPMPGNLMAPSLAESWTVSADQKVYEFKLREGVKFHNGDPFTAEDVKFSFQRSKVGKVLKDRVRDVEIVSPSRVRFHLQEPFPDFMAFYGTLATGAAWIVPKKYVESVGDDGFKKRPVGLGPYKFVSHTPGIELVMEAYEGYWRKTPSVKRLVFKTVPDATTRAAMLKNGEVDVAYMLDSPTALELKRDPTIRLAFSGAIGIHYLDFFDQWDPKSPWYDRRVRLAAVMAVDRRALNESETLGASRLTGAMVPRKFEFALPLEPYPYDPAKSRQLLAEAGYPNGLEVTLDAYNTGPGPNIAQSIQATMAQGGVKVSILQSEQKAVITKYRARQHQMLLIYWGPDYMDPHTNADSFARNPDNSDNPKTKPLAWRNSWDIPEITKMTDAAVRERDSEKRAEMYESLQRKVMQEGPFIILFQDSKQVALRNNVKNFVMGPTSDLVFYRLVTK